MNRLTSIRLASVAVPFACTLVAIIIIVFQVRRLQQLQNEQALAVRQIRFIDQLAREMASRPPLRKVASVPASVQEQPLFLNMLRSFAISSSVKLEKYANKPVPAAVPGQTTGQGTGPNSSANALPAGVIALSSDVEVSGDYNSIRQFLYLLMRSPRLYNTTDLHWTASADKWPNAHLTFSLLRYVSAATASNAPVAPQPPATGPAGLPGNG